MFEAEQTDLVACNGGLASRRLLPIYRKKATHSMIHHEVSGTIRPKCLKFGRHVTFLSRDILRTSFVKIDFQVGRLQGLQR
ncbi:hypothetical protein TNCV_3426591 [Trichonephila clavipes]|nr:hypothetical protein TNCV_3426591 [Trichonephila clavipes]